MTEGLRCSAQAEFEAFVSKFPLVHLPIDSVQFLELNDTLDVKLFNNVVWDSQPKEQRNGKSRTTRPKVYRDGKLLELGGFGKASDISMNFETVDGKKGKFYTKVYSIGRINLNADFITLIVKLLTQS